MSPRLLDLLARPRAPIDEDESTQELVARIKISKSKRLFETALAERSSDHAVVEALGTRCKYLSDAQFQRLVAILVEQVKLNQTTPFWNSYERAIFAVLGGNNTEVSGPQYQGTTKRHPSTSDAMYLFSALGGSRGDWEVGVLSLVFGRSNGGRSVSLTEAQLTKRVEGARALCEMLDWLDVANAEKARGLRRHVSGQNFLLGSARGHPLLDEYYSLIVRLEGPEFFGDIAGPGDNHAAHAVARRDYLTGVLRSRFDGTVVPEAAAEVAMGLVRGWHLGVDELCDTTACLFESLGGDAGGGQNRQS
jgi:hypothetical protein